MWRWLTIFLAKPKSVTLRRDSLMRIFSGLRSLNEKNGTDEWCRIWRFQWRQGRCISSSGGRPALTRFSGVKVTEIKKMLLCVDFHFRRTPGWCNNCWRFREHRLIWMRIELPDDVLVVEVALDLDLLVKGIFHVRGGIDWGRKGGTFIAIDYFRGVLFVGGLMLAEVDFSEWAFVDDFVLVDNIALYSFFYHLLFDLIIITPPLSSCQHQAFFYINSQLIASLSGLCFY